MTLPSIWWARTYSAATRTALPGEIVNARRIGGIELAQRAEVGHDHRDRGEDGEERREREADQLQTDVGDAAEHDHPDA